jgi:D-sedoheptulose 7-phosphate isomerase
MDQQMDQRMEIEQRKNDQNLDVKLLQTVRAIFRDSMKVKEQLLGGDHLNVLINMAKIIAASIIGGGKLMLCGNGGSAADAQHLAAELLIRLRSHVNREAIPAIPLAMDSSSITACGNDYGFEALYERMVAGLGRPGDVLLGITTSGKSPNVIRALQYAKKHGIKTLGFLGGTGGPALNDCDYAFVVPTTDTGRIQESHITAGHALMEMIEELLLVKGSIQNTTPVEPKIEALVNS